MDLSLRQGPRTRPQLLVGHDERQLRRYRCNAIVDVSGWFSASVCANVTTVVAGTISITRADGISFSGPFDLVLAHAGRAAQVPHGYWPVFGLTCPWYRTFSESLAANPMPLPFDGIDWPPLDCSFAP